MIEQDSLLNISTSPIVSVIITTYNHEHYLEMAVQSVLKQTFSDLECLVVDDGSIDNTGKVSQDIMSQDPRVKYLYKENGGVCSARNFGMEHARGEWIQFLDGDDWLHQDKIRFQLEYIKNYDSDSVVLYCDQERVYETEGRTELFYEYDCSSKEQVIEKLLTPWGLQCNGLLLKKSVATKARFEPRLKYFEDCHYQLDLLMQGISFIHSPIIGHFYRVHQSNTSTFSDVSSSTANIKDSYILYFQLVQQKYKSLRQKCQMKLVDFLKRTIEQKDTQRFSQILSLLDMPVKLYGFKFNTKEQLNFLQIISLYIPIQGIYNLVRVFKTTLSRSV